MRRYLAKALAIFLVAFSASALAMGLGDIRLNSYLNQRLDAEIELVSAAADEVDTLEVALADRAAYERVGLERPAILGSLEFEVVRRPNGTAYIKVTSDKPIREPFLTFLVRADWSRGRLLREYTLLLDPPTFADREPPAEARSPVAADVPSQPEPQPQPRQQAEVEPAPQEEPVTSEPMPAQETAPAIEEAKAEQPVAETPAEDVNIPPLEADRDETRQQPVYRQAPTQATGDSYGPIQRNETLWSIASRLRPDASVTMNQMMVAIYRANPEAFAGNMNRMKRGYILRIPDFNAVTSLSRAEAFRAAKQMNEEWEGSRSRVASEDFRTEPEADDSLSLVAPEEDVEPEVGTGVGAGGEADDIGAPEEAAVELGEDDVDSAAVDLVEDDAETADRLIDIEDESMQAMQAGADDEAPADEAAPDAMAEQMADEAMPSEDELTGETEGEAIDDLPPLPEEDVAAADEATEADAGQPTADADATAAEAEQPAETEPAPSRKTVVTTPRQPEQGLVDRILAFVLSPIGLGAVGGLLVLILGVIALMQRRRKQAQAQAASEMADWLAEEEGEDRTETAGDEDETILAGDREDETERGSDDLDDVFGRDEEMAGSGTEAISEDETDSTQMIRPEDRPDIGGESTSAETSDDDTFGGGETVMLDENDPLSEADFNMAYGLYDQAAEVVQKAADREPKRADLWAKLCEIHFAANNKDEFMTAARKLKDVAGTDGEDWRNVAIMGQQISPNDELFAGGSAGGGVDLDFSASDEESGGDETDFESTMTGSVTEEPAAPQGAADTSDADELDFDLDIGGPDEEEAPSPAPAKAETPAESDEDLDFDLDFGTGDEEEGEPAGKAAAETADESDDFDLGDMDLGDFDSSDDSDTDFGTAADAAVSREAGEESSSESADYDSDNTQTEFDKALSELSAYVDTNLPEGGAGDEVSTGEETGGDELNLDEFNFDKESEGSDDYSSAEDEEEGLGEIGTKLDLARAYVDMGDPDGARSILEEVVEDGDEQQKQEAQDLLDKL